MDVCKVLASPTTKQLSPAPPWVAAAYSPGPPASPPGSQQAAPPVLAVALQSFAKGVDIEDLGLHTPLSGEAAAPWSAGGGRLLLAAATASSSQGSQAACNGAGPGCNGGSAEALRLEGGGRVWVAPDNLQQLLDACAAAPATGAPPRFLGGNTGAGGCLRRGHHTSLHVSYLSRRRHAAACWPTHCCRPGPIAVHAGLFCELWPASDGLVVTLGHVKEMREVAVAEVRLQRAEGARTACRQLPQYLIALVGRLLWPTASVAALAHTPRGAADPPPCTCCSMPACRGTCWWAPR